MKITDEEFKNAIKTLQEAMWVCTRCKKSFKSDIFPSEIDFIYSEGLKDFVIKGYICKKCSKL